SAADATGAAIGGVLGDAVAVLALAAAAARLAIRFGGDTARARANVRGVANRTTSAAALSRIGVDAGAVAQEAAVVRVVGVGATKRPALPLPRRRAREHKDEESQEPYVPKRSDPESGHAHARSQLITPQACVLLKKSRRALLTPLPRACLQDSFTTS